MLSLIETRNRHFLNACRQALVNYPKGEVICLETLIDRAIHSEAPHYYCTYTYALRMIRVLRHGRLRLRRDRRYLQWEELSDRCRRLEESREWSLPRALAHVLARGKASQFFIAVPTGKYIFLHR